MALKKNFEMESGLEIPDAYFRIDAFRGDRHNVRLTVGVYVSEQHRFDGKPAIASIEVTLPTPNTESNMFAAAYQYLKTQPEFEGAVDA